MNAYISLGSNLGDRAGNLLLGITLPRPEKLLARLLRIEYSLGRTREAAMAPRTIDLDLLFYANETSDTQFLTLPHPRLHRRRFVLVPLNELAPTLVHPKLNKTMTELLEELDDASEVNLWKP